MAIRYPPKTNRKAQAEMVKKETAVRERAGEKVMIGSLNCKIGGGKREDLWIHKGDDPHELAVGFCQKHGLNEDWRKSTEQFIRKVIHK